MASQNDTFICEIFTRNSLDYLCHTVFTYLDFDVSRLDVEADLKMEVLYYRGEYLHPAVLEWGVSVRRYPHLPHLRLPALQHRKQEHSHTPRAPIDNQCQKIGINRKEKQKPRIWFKLLRFVPKKIFSPFRFDLGLEMYCCH